MFSFVVVVIMLLLWIELLGCMMVVILVFIRMCVLLLKGKNVLDVVIFFVVWLFVCLIVSL